MQYELKVFVVVECSPDHPDIAGTVEQAVQYALEVSNDDPAFQFISASVDGEPDEVN